MIERLTNTNGIPPEIKYSYFLWIAIAVVGVLFSIGSSLLFADETSPGGTGVTVVAILVALIFGLVYIFLAVRMKEGANWARVVLSVFAGLSVIGTVIAVAGPFSVGLSTSDWIISIATILAGALMWLPKAQTWYKHHRMAAARP